MCKEPANVSSGDSQSMEEPFLPPVRSRRVGNFVPGKQRILPLHRRVTDIALRVRPVRIGAPAPVAAPVAAIDPKEQFTCPTSQQKFAGACPIKKCPANIAEAGKEKSGCIYIYLNKHEISTFDIAFATGLPLKKVKAQIAEGEQQVRFAIFCHDALDRLRDKNARQRHCPNCGVLRTTAGECVNKRQCQFRQRLVRYVVKRSFLDIPERPLRNQDVFLLLHHRKEMEQLITARNKMYPDQVQRKFADLISLPALGETVLATMV